MRFPLWTMLMVPYLLTAFTTVHSSPLLYHPSAGTTDWGEIQHLQRRFMGTLISGIGRGIGSVLKGGKNLFRSGTSKLKGKANRAKEKVKANAEKKKEEKSKKKEQEEAKKKEQDEAKKKEQDEAKKKEQDEAKKKEQEDAKKKEQEDAKKKEEEDAKKKEETTASKGGSSATENLGNAATVAPAAGMSKGDKAKYVAGGAAVGVGSTMLTNGSGEESGQVMEEATDAGVDNPADGVTETDAVPDGSMIPDSQTTSTVPVQTSPDANTAGMPGVNVQTNELAGSANPVVASNVPVAQPAGVTNTVATDQVPMTSNVITSSTGNTVIMTDS